MITEVHTHTTFSHDGLDDLETMVDSAKARGVGIYGISEHYDYDYVVCGVRYQGDVPPPITDSEKYFSCNRRWQWSCNGTRESRYSSGDYRKSDR